LSSISSSSNVRKSCENDIVDILLWLQVIENTSQRY
jgi:hypothetical protein